MICCPGVHRPSVIVRSICTVKSFQDILGHLHRHGALDERDAYAAFTRILNGLAEPAEAAALLSLIAVRGPSVGELVGGARAMREHVTPVAAPSDGRVLIDTCGTGGAPKTFNVSTVGAIVTAAAAPGRVLVAKHGSVSKTGRGSSEVMQALGVNVAASPAVQRRCLDELGVCFSFSMHHHPAMKHVAPVRKALGFPTIFNLLGPLTNPAGATRQLVGTYNQTIAHKLAETLLRLGVERAMVVASEDGLDELTPTAPSTVRFVEHGVIRTFTFEPQLFGIQRCLIDDLVVDSLDEAARVFRAIVSGERGPKGIIVALNAGAALFVAGVVPSVREGFELATRTIQSGRAAQVLHDLVRLSNEV